MIALTGLGLSVASAQTSSQSQTTRSASATNGSGQYYFEFRSRQAWDYGHTFVVFGRVGEAPSKKILPHEIPACVHNCLGQRANHVIRKLLIGHEIKRHLQGLHIVIRDNRSETCTDRENLPPCSLHRRVHILQIHPAGLPTMFQGSWPASTIDRKPCICRF